MNKLLRSLDLCYLLYPHISYMATAAAAALCVIGATGRMVYTDRAGWFIISLRPRPAMFCHLLTAARVRGAIKHD